MMAKACSLVLDQMYNKSSSARESLVDLATRTLDGKSTLWVIGFGATGIKCSRQWKTNILVWRLHDCLCSTVLIGD